jgi:hypothetical protein
MRELCPCTSCSALEPAGRDVITLYPDAVHEQSSAQHLVELGDELVSL